MFLFLTTDILNLNKQHLEILPFTDKFEESLEAVKF